MRTFFAKRLKREREINIHEIVFWITAFFSMLFLIVLIFHPL
ncbi:MAG: hypothetical protein JWP12_707 [Bacteroidetes bacterium]|nr:hypothetical protein [Bacteroidota bacterium]